MSTCPGQDHRKLSVRDVTCPNCGNQVEMFSDELRLRCPRCKTMVYQEQMPSCIQWCQAARDCLGPKMYDELMGKKPAADDSGELGRFSPRPTQTLSEEHKLILRAIDLAEAEARALGDSGELRRERLERLLDFFRQFADRFHHAKEEELLFKKMAARGMPLKGSPLEVMLAEHESFRKHVGRVTAILENGAAESPPSKQEMAKHLVEYTHGLRNHIFKEDQVLYPMADDLLSPADQEDLAQEFAQTEAGFEDGFYDRYHRLVIDLART